ncbi:MAG: hypothetical protein OXF27_08255 [Acidobacteria bacterium]|nr:hypothetical protein [Acidobacteriota bacterium]
MTRTEYHAETLRAAMQATPGQARREARKRFVALRREARRERRAVTYWRRVESALARRELAA